VSLDVEQFAVLEAFAWHVEHIWQTVEPGTPKVPSKHAEQLKPSPEKPELQEQFTLSVGVPAGQLVVTLAFWSHFLHAEQYEPFP